MSALESTPQGRQGQGLGRGQALSGQPGSVEHELGFYAAFHSNKINKMIHFVCIPIILWTALIFLAKLVPPGVKTIVYAPGLAMQPNGAMAVLSGYFMYYILLEPVAAITFAPILTLMYLSATYLANYTPLSLPFRNTSGFAQPSSIPFAIALHVGGWIAQFIGHGVFEKRAPALMTNLVQALVLAPFFVHIEMLFEFFGYRPELERGMLNAAGKRIASMNRESRAKKA